MVFKCVMLLRNHVASSFDLSSKCQVSGILNKGLTVLRSLQK